MTVSAEWLGLAGMGLCVVAYLPQIIHLIKEHCSAGLSPPAYGVWTLAASLLLAYAIVKKDPVFISLQGYHLAAGAVILRYCLRYRDQRCEEHGGEPLSMRLQRNEPSRLPGKKEAL